MAVVKFSDGKILQTYIFPSEQICGKSRGEVVEKLGRRPEFKKLALEPGDPIVLLVKQFLNNMLLERNSV